MAIEDKDGVKFRGRGPRGERLARKLNSIVEQVKRATPADAGHKNVRIRKTERGAIFTGTPGGVGVGVASDPQLHVGALTTSDPYPTPAEMTTAIEAAIDEGNPKKGDIVILTRDSGDVVAAKFTLIEPGSPENIGLWLRTVTEGASTFRAVGGQTGAYA